MKLISKTMLHTDVRRSNKECLATKLVLRFLEKQYLLRKCLINLFSSQALISNRIFLCLSTLLDFFTRNQDSHDLGLLGIYMKSNRGCCGLKQVDFCLYVGLDVWQQVDVVGKLRLSLLASASWSTARFLRVAWCWCLWSSQWRWRKAMGREDILAWLRWWHLKPGKGNCYRWLGTGYCCIYLEATSSLSWELHSAVQFLHGRTIDCMKGLAEINEIQVQLRLPFKVPLNVVGLWSVLCRIHQGRSHPAHPSACCRWCFYSCSGWVWCRSCWTMQAAGYLSSWCILLRFLSLTASQCTHSAILLESFSIPRPPDSTCR